MKYIIVQILTVLARQTSAPLGLHFRDYFLIETEKLNDHWQAKKAVGAGSTSNFLPASPLTSLVGSRKRAMEMMIKWPWLTGDDFGSTEAVATLPHSILQGTQILDIFC